MKTPNPRRRLDAAFALTQKGDFAGIGTIVKALSSKDREVRLAAAYDCQRIGCPEAIEPLTRMAVRDPDTHNRNGAIFALAGIGRPKVVPGIIAALNDEKSERREDARAALLQVVKPDVFGLFADEDFGGERDPDEARRVESWWKEQSSRFDDRLVYSMGEPGGPGNFIRQLKATKSRLPDAILDALRDWTGQDFGEAPLSKVVKKWEKWWTENQSKYEPGKRYFHGHPVP